LALGEQFPTVLAAAQARAEWAVAALYREYQPFILRYLRAQDRSVAEDLAADVWVVAAPRLTSFEGDESGFRAWLFTIARRRLIEHRRRCSRRRTDVTSPLDLCARPSGSDPEGDAVDAVSAQQAIDRLIAELTPEQAEVVLLRVVGGLDALEVGRIVGKTAGAVRVIQHRALRHLATSFQAEQQVVTQ
jgi:RNA polymerase sigma-70 factor (ECF subfamily)